ncbi:MAG: 50S ribosomal protein L27 [Candidatus Nealsonbacteria bacterium]|nr:50S ribosomal protein L27 [Candidatus Nealsonbacteria bacterium]
MAKTKASGATRLGRDSQPKYLGIKLYEGEIAKPGQILVRQRGTKFLAGQNVKRGGDDTLYAMKAGLVKFKTFRKRSFDNSQRIAKTVNIELLEAKEDGKRTRKRK